MVSEDVVDRHQGGCFREIDRVRVKGKENPVSIFELMDHRIDENLLKKEIALNEQALQAYRTADWTVAERIYKELLELTDRPQKYTLFLERIENFKINPPKADWLGVFDHQTK